jgi:NAD(P)-dependent dehydrogenase (short-subunit alcohol dehydrogenase family)
MAALEQKVLFIIGGGPRIGHAVAKKFLSQGYKVAIGRRNTEKTELDGILRVYVDATKPETIEEAFREVESKLGVPNAIVYNGKWEHNTLQDPLKD